MMRKRSGLFILLLVSFVIMVGCSNKRNVQQKKIFRVGMTVGYPPFNWVQNSDQNSGVKVDSSIEYVGGYDVEIAQKVADGLGKKISNCENRVGRISSGTAIK